jgi:hypothetical protein
MQSLHHTLLNLCKYLMVQTSLWQMVCTRTFEDPIPDILEGFAGCGRGQVPCGTTPPPSPCPPVNLEQLLATQNDLMCLLMENETCHGVDHQQPQHQDRDSSYSDFLATHPPIFAEVTGPPRGAQLASHDRVQLWATALYRVSENSVCIATTPRLSWSLVGLLHHHTTHGSSGSMG